MMKHYFVVSMLMFMVGCSAIRPETNALAPLEARDIMTGSLQTRPAVVVFNGGPAMLYATKDDRVAFQVGSHRTLLDETARVKGGRYFQLHHHGQNLDATWWSHEDGKNLYFTTSTDGGQHFSPVSMVNDAHGVLPPFTLIRGAGDVVGMSYLDERQPHYQAYFNRSIDDGKTWAMPDQRLDVPAEGQASDVHELQSVRAGNIWFSVWTDVTHSANQIGFRIVSRYTDDEGVTWSAPAVLYSSDKQISSMIVRAKGSNVAIAADEDGRGIIALTSQDSGHNWNSVGVLAESADATNSGLDMALSGGRAHLVWMQEKTGEKTRIMRASLDVYKSKWIGTAQRLDRKIYENTRSISPSVLSTHGGERLFATWVDYRDIRPNIYLSVSLDQGDTWSAPQALLMAGEVSAGWPKLVPWEDQVAIAYETYPNDSVKDGRFFLKLLPGADANGLTGLPEQLNIDESSRRKRLEQRVNSLWENRIAGNYEPTYDMFDYAFKLATTKKTYLESVGVITYLSFSLNDISVKGNEAEVKVKVKYEVKPTMLPMGGKPLTVPPVEVEFDTTWVWIGSDWFMVYHPAIGPQELKY
jgi:hypothetical protein